MGSGVDNQRELKVDCMHKRKENKMHININSYEQKRSIIKAIFMMRKQCFKMQSTVGCRQQTIDRNSIRLRIVFGYQNYATILDRRYNNGAVELSPIFSLFLPVYGVVHSMQLIRTM